MTAVAVAATPISGLTSSPNAAQPTDAADAAAPAYTIVASGVSLVSEKVRTNARLQSALSTLQSYLPLIVSETAVKSAGQLQQLSQTYAQPIVARVDGKLSHAIVSVMAAPQRTVAYGQETISAVDSFAFAHTPEVLKPTYAATRTKTLSVVHSATERVVALKRQSGDPLWGRLTSKLTQLSANLQSVRQTLVDAGANAVAVAHVGERIADLQAKIGAAVAATRAKGAQARALSTDVLRAVSEAGLSVVNLVESSLTKQQAEIVHGLWSRVLETVSSVRDTLQLGTPSTTATVSPVSSRSNSTASTSSLNFDEVDGKIESVPSGSDQDANGADKSDEHVLADDQDEAAPTETTAAATKAKPHNKKHAKKKHAAPKAQQEAEQKEKVADEQNE